jgi:hypothetical protein
MNRIFRLLPLVVSGSLLLYAGCSGSDEPTKVDCAASDLDVTFVSVNPASCAVSNGTITATATGGKEPYTYALNAGTFTSNPAFTQLSAGDYVLRVKDKNGCTVNTDDIQLRIPGNDLNATTSTEPDTECVGNNGSITVNATGGTEPYQFKLNTGAFGSSATFASLAPGNYTVTIQDDAGCVFPKSVTVGRGDTGTSLSIDIMPIIEANCAVSNCHNGSEDPNLSSPQNVRNNASKIRSLTQSGEMPKEGSLSSSEKAKIACWVDDGAKDN